MRPDIVGVGGGVRGWWTLVAAVGCVGITKESTATHTGAHSGSVATATTESVSGVYDSTPGEDTGDCDNTTRRPEDEVTAPTAARVEGCPPLFSPLAPAVAGCTSRTEIDDAYTVVIEHYDEQGRVVSSSTSTYQVEETVTWTYDPVTGALVAAAQYDGDELLYLTTFDNLYDADGRVLSSVSSDGVESTWTYGPCGVELYEGTIDGRPWWSDTTTWYVDGHRLDEDEFWDGVVDRSRAVYVDPVSGAPREEWIGEEVFTQTHDPVTGWLVQREFNGLLSGKVERFTYDAEGRVILVDVTDRCGDSWYWATTWTCP